MLVAQIEAYNEAVEDAANKAEVGTRNYITSPPTEESYGDETSFRFIMKNKNDEDKEFIMTIKCYNIPKKWTKQR